MKNTAVGILLGIAVALVLILVVLPVLAMAIMSVGGMMGSGGMGGMMGSGGIGGMMGQAGSTLWPGWLMLVFWLLVVAGFILLVVWGARRRAPPDSTIAHEAPLMILQRRYAQGEIGREEYEAAREVLLRDRVNR